jgi:hypothetical protein
MGRPFESDGTPIRVGLDAQERQLLAHLLDEVGELLDDGRRPGGDPLVELVGFDLQLPDDFPPAGDDFPPAASAAAPDAPGSASDARGDPALARLLPQGHRDDPQLAAEFRRLTETGLRSRKRAHLALASAALQRTGSVMLSPDEAAALLKGLTDIRLVLGERLGLRTDDDAEVIVDALRRRPGGDNPWASAALLYDVLTWWQESLVTALSR